MFWKSLHMFCVSYRTLDPDTFLKNLYCSFLTTYFHFYLFNPKDGLSINLIKNHGLTNLTSLVNKPVWGLIYNDTYIKILH